MIAASPEMAILLALFFALSPETASAFTTPSAPAKRISPTHRPYTRFSVRGNSASAATALRMEVVDVDMAIVGGGPAGCTCALYTARSDLSTIIVDKNPATGALAGTG